MRCDCNVPLIGYELRFIGKQMPDSSPVSCGPVEPPALFLTDSCTKQDICQSVVYPPSQPADVPYGLRRRAARIVSSSRRKTDCVTFSRLAAITGLKSLLSVDGDLTIHRILADDRTE